MKITTPKIVQDSLYQWYVAQLQNGVHLNTNVSKKQT